MAIFGSKKKIEKKEAAPKVEKTEVIRGVSMPNEAKSFSHIIIRPRITEKATMKSEEGVYTFDINQRATKNSVKEAVRAIFKVSPIKVTIVPIKSKVVTARGKHGRTASGKKAYVFLKKGDKIEFV